MKRRARILVAAAATCGAILAVACGSLKSNGFPSDAGSTSDGMAPATDDSGPNDGATADASDASVDAPGPNDGATADAGDASDAPDEADGPWVVVTSEPMISTIAAGPNNQIWAIGTRPWSPGSLDKTDYRLVDGGWATSQGGNVQVSVAPDTGIAWVVNTAGVVFYFDASRDSFEPLSWTPAMSTLSVGPNGQIWAIGSTLSTPGNEGTYEFELDGGDGGWTQNSSGRAIQISVAPDTGVAWIVDWTGIVSHLVDGGFQPVSSNPPNPPIASIAVGPGGHLWAVGGTAGVTGDMAIYSSDGGGTDGGLTWEQEPGAAIMISVTPDTGVPWIVNAAGTVLVHR
ncbi:MAG TPA: hypothetical protein VGI39_40895 [Polyangiaceae bacterium]